MFGRKQTALVDAEQTLPGRSERPWHLADKHLVLGTPLVTDTAPAGFEVAVFGLGCFWGAEEIYWQVPGVWSTSVGYAGGTTPNPSYEEVCSGRTNHTEAVRVVFDPSVVSFASLVKTFFVQAFFIPSGSMEQTLHGCPGCTGDRVLVNKIPYWFGNPEPGDIVVFLDPRGQRRRAEQLVHRRVAVAGPHRGRGAAE